MNKHIQSKKIIGPDEWESCNLEMSLNLDVGEKLLDWGSDEHQAFITSKEKEIARLKEQQNQRKASYDNPIYRVSNALAFSPQPVNGAWIHSEYSIFPDQGIRNVINIRGSKMGWRKKILATLALDRFVHCPISPKDKITIDSVSNLLFHMHGLLSQVDPSLAVHCMYGEDRSPLMIMLYLRAMGLPYEAALDLIRLARPGFSPEKVMRFCPEHVIKFALIVAQNSMKIRTGLLHVLAPDLIIND